MKEIAERFWAKVDRRGDDECWEWMAFRDNLGYGKFNLRGRMVVAHRVALLLVGRDAPENMESDHLCRNRACVNPAHLEYVTHRENTLRGNATSAFNVKKTHCPKGHGYTAGNTDLRYGRRYCRACQRATGAERTRRWRERRGTAA